LDTTVHEERFAEGDLGAKIDAYDRPARGQASLPQSARDRAFRPQRIEDKARQYAVPLRVDFGAFVRAKGFRLD
jgi:hypothetical protein